MFKRFLARIGCNVEKTSSVYETIDSKDEDISILCKLRQTGMHSSHPMIKVI